MPTSRLGSYTWSCPTCKRSNRGLAWSIVDGQERPDLLEDDLWSQVEIECPACGTAVPITAPLVVVRARAEAPVLLALPDPPLNGEDTAAIDALLSVLRQRLGDLAGELGPPLPVRRSLLPVVLTRDLLRDVSEPEAAVSGMSEGDAEGYRRFLENLAEFLADQRAAQALSELLTITSLEDLQTFLEAQPEVRDERARTLARQWLSSGPPEGESDTPMRAFVRLVERLGAGEDSEAWQEWADTVGRFWSDEVVPGSEQLVASLDDTSGRVSSYSLLSVICADGRYCGLSV